MLCLRWVKTVEATLCATADWEESQGLVQINELYVIMIAPPL